MGYARKAVGFEGSPVFTGRGWAGRDSSPMTLSSPFRQILNRDRCDGRSEVEVLRTAGFLAIGLAIAVVAAGLSSAAPMQKKVEPEPAPYFILPTWDGEVVKSTGLKGQVVLMAFFQTWCPDCQRTNPLLEKLYRKYKDRGLVVLGISHDRGKAKDVEPYIKKYGLTYPILLGDISIAMNYVKASPQRPNFSIPYLVLVDRKGNIVGRFVEGSNEETHDLKKLEARITPLL